MRTLADVPLIAGEGEFGGGAAPGVWYNVVQNAYAADALLAMAGKVSGDLQEVIRLRPRLFADLIRELKNMPDQAVLRLVREVRDGDW